MHIINYNHLTYFNIISERHITSSQPILPHIGPSAELSAKHTLILSVTAFVPDKSTYLLTYSLSYLLIYLLTHSLT